MMGFETYPQIGFIDAGLSPHCAEPVTDELEKRSLNDASDRRRLGTGAKAAISEYTRKVKSRRLACERRVAVARVIVMRGNQIPEV